MSLTPEKSRFCSLITPAKKSPLRGRKWFSWGRTFRAFAALGLRTQEVLVLSAARVSLRNCGVVWAPGAGRVMLGRAGHPIVASSTTPMLLLLHLHPRRICARTHMYTDMYTHMHASIQLSSHACMDVWMHIYTSVWSTNFEHAKLPMLTSGS